ncbi:MAG: hypothetical protein JNK48_31895 [Bryobacterales bacterium]|nr:hypothetical protein [Bryobacterales bacterium]
MHDDLPKQVKAVLRELAGKAHEKALTQVLSQLDGDFQAWRKGEITPFELAQRIHLFHQGPDRQIHLRYTRSVDLEFLVVQSVREGFLDREEIPADVMPYLESAFALFRDAE